MNFKANKAKTKYTSGKYKIIPAQGAKVEGERIPIFHCYYDGDYIGQSPDLDGAKQVCNNYPVV